VYAPSLIENPYIAFQLSFFSTPFVRSKFIPRPFFLKCLDHSSCEPNLQIWYQICRFFSNGSRVMLATVPIPALASASVLQSAAVGDLS